VGELVARQKRDGAFPSVAELSEMGELGRMVKWSKSPRMLDLLRDEVQKRLVSS
jgi:hypothetical protein